jgi:hypothetical protein
LNKQELFYKAIKLGHTEIVRTLIKEVDPSVVDNWAIRWASLNGSV